MFATRGHELGKLANYSGYLEQGRSVTAFPGSLLRAMLPATVETSKFGAALAWRIRGDYEVFGTLRIRV